MTAPFLGDALGPRGRRRVLVATVVSGAGLVGLAYVVIARLVESGQLHARLWTPLLEPGTIRFLLGGLANTVKAAVVAMVLSIAAGIVLALGRLARSLPLRVVTGTYVEFFRAVPLILLILFCGIGLPRYGVDLGVFWFLVLGLTIYNGAVLGEIFRAGVMSLDRGQHEAASAVGLTYRQSMALVVLPQAARRMLPAIVSQLVTLLKDTSLGVVITYEELLRRGRIAGEFSHNLLQSLLVVAVVYILVNTALSSVARRLEARQRRRYRAGPIKVTGVEDLAVLNAGS
ncbi:MAG: amino acid ABC transporter permease [Acidimicrobiales bacterium]